MTESSKTQCSSRQSTEHDVHSRLCTHICCVYQRSFTELTNTILKRFPGLKKRIFKDFPGYTPFTNMVGWGQKVHNCTYQISFRCNCIIVNESKCSTCGHITVLQWTQNSPPSTATGYRGDKMHTMYYYEFLLQGVILEPESKISRTTTLEFQDFSKIFRDMEVSTF